ncbi:MAG TPA: FAD:protein FMN transferase [Fastidiosipila sp.]|nr:FAD:protein FMN transferase [Fastidiosipila sp.]
MSMRIKHMLAVVTAGLILFSAACGANVQTPATTTSRAVDAATSATEPAELTRYRSSFLGVFDTLTTVIGYAESQDAFDEYMRVIRDKLTFYHQIFNTYDAFEGVNNLKTVNEKAGIEPVEVDPEIIELLKQCIWANEVSDGNVNVAFGAVLKIWHDHREIGIHDPERASVPDKATLEAANQHTDISQIEIDEERSTVFLKDPEMRLDVGSGSKGYATEQVAREVEAMGLKSAVISVGGNIRAIGIRPDSETPWRIGIQNPDKEQESNIIELLSIDNLSVVTSGVYERFYAVDGVRYHHIIDPETLFPEDTFDAVTIVTPSSALADALTTALFNMSLEDGMALIGSMENCEALWLKGEERFMTEGFEKYIVRDAK